MTMRTMRIRDKRRKLRRYKLNRPKLGESMQADGRTKENMNYEYRVLSKNQDGVEGLEYRLDEAY
jgi:hypothetical protein